MADGKLCTRLKVPDGTTPANDRVGLHGAINSVSGASAAVQSAAARYPGGQRVAICYRSMEPPRRLQGGSLHLLGQLRSNLEDFFWSIVRGEGG